jgi:hypothetical protein
MMPESEFRKPGETGERNPPETRDRSRIHSAADQIGQEARQAGEKSAEAAKQTAETAADATRRTAEAAADVTRRVAARGNEVAMSSLRAIAGAQGPLADAGFDQSQRALEVTTRVTDVYHDAAERAANDLDALIGSWTSLGRGLQRWQHAYFDQLQQFMGSVARKRQDLLRCNSPVELATVQRDLYVDLVKRAFEANTTLLQLTGQIAQEAVRPLRERAHT